MGQKILNGPVSDGSNTNEAVVSMQDMLKLARWALPHAGGAALAVLAFLEIAEAEIILPIALVFGAAQVMTENPPPKELAEHLKNRRMREAAITAGNYTVSNAHHLLDRKNIFGKTFATMGGPLGKRLARKASVRVLRHLSRLNSKKPASSFSLV